MRRGDAIFFCEPCIVSADFESSSPITPEMAQVGADREHGSDTEWFTFYFGEEDTETGDWKYSESIGGTYQGNTYEAARIRELANANNMDDDEDRFGRAFCERISKCTGMIVTDGGRICPAMNNIELRKLT